MSVGLDLLNITMSDSNNNFFKKMDNLSEADTSTTDFFRKPFDSSDIRQLSQKFENLMVLQNYGTISGDTDETNSGTNDEMVDSTILSRLDPLAKEYEVPYNRPNTIWNSTNGLSNGWTAHQSVDLKAKDRMRAITKTPNETNKGEYVQRRTSNGSTREGKDWYNTFVEQTQRFARMNGKSEHYFDRKHVRFQDVNHYWDKEPDESILGTSGSSMDSSYTLTNGFNNIKDNNRTEFDERKSREAEQTSDSFYTFPKLEMKGSIVESLYNGVLKPAANNFQKEWQYGQSQWNKNMADIRNTLNSSALFGDSIWTNPSTSNNPFNRFYSDPEEGNSKIHNLLVQMKKTIPKSMANYTWSGQLPRKIRTKNQVFSCKVFLGGIPYDLTDSDLHCTFAQFGHIQIQWPGKDIKSAIDGTAANKAGYVYIIFENYENVAALLSSCTISYRDMDSGCRWYFNISSRRQKGKEVQVIPFDIGDRFFMKSSFTGQMEHSRTVFVGALHGMLSADGLAKVMDDLFGGVVFAGLDTDKYKYPLGSGRVIFDNQDSYLKAVSAAFVEIKSARFKKKIQIDPYIENESQCSICKITQQSPVFCREELLYFCHKCWEFHHSDPESVKHRPIIKSNKSSAL